MNFIEGFVQELEKVAAGPRVTFVTKNQRFWRNNDKRLFREYDRGSRISFALERPGADSDRILRVIKADRHEWSGARKAEGEKRRLSSVEDRRKASTFSDYPSYSKYKQRAKVESKRLDRDIRAIADLV